MLIGMLDSGAGGITVLNECRKALPCADFLYYADDLNAPYGNQSAEAITAHTFKAVDYLVGRGARCIVLACNTATSAAVELLRMRYAINIIGIEPALLPAVKDGSKKILLLCTAATARLKKLDNLIKTLNADITVLPSDLAAKIENNLSDLTAIKPYIAALLAPYQGFDAVVLGCTHYCFVGDIISDVLRAPAFDGNKGVASMLARTCAADGKKRGSTQIVLSSANSRRQQLYETLLE